MIEYRQATLTDLDAIVTVHVQAFEGFFLTKLGRGFLTEMYLGFLSQTDGCLWVAVDDTQQVIGFVAGTVAPDHFFATLRRHRAFYFLWHAIPAVLRQPMLVIPKLYAALFYRGDQPAQLVGGALLSSIGVLPQYVGQAVGLGLLHQFEQVVWQKQQPFIYLTTDALNNHRVNQFYQRQGYQVESTFLQSGQRHMFRYVKQHNTSASP